jgi:hypothetical protein
VVDQGNVFISSSFIAACESLGISVQPAPQGNGPAKGHVERTFSSINTLFVQHVAGYTASHTGERGKDTEGEAVWTLAHLAEMFQEWIICGWQEGTGAVERPRLLLTRQVRLNLGSGHRVLCDECQRM